MFNIVVFMATLQYLEFDYIKGPNPLGTIPVGRFPLGDSVGGEIRLIRRVGRLFGESADDYNLHTHSQVHLKNDSELKSAVSSANSNADAAKVGVWVWALTRITK